MGFACKNDLVKEEERLNSVIRTAEFVRDQHKLIANKEHYDLDARLDGRKCALFGLNANTVSLWGENKGGTLEFEEDTQIYDVGTTDGHGRSEDAD
jgi:hypothetical protein